MKKQKESAATRQSHRAHSKPALRRKPRPSVAQLNERRERMLCVIDHLACAFVGAAIMYVLMHLAAAL